MFIVKIIHFTGCGNRKELEIQKKYTSQTVLLKIHKDAGFENLYFPEELKIRQEIIY